MQGSKWALAVAVVAALLIAAPARAAVFTVTTTGDTTPSPTPACAATCSLRQAIEAANGTTGADQVIVPAGTYSLTSGVLTATAFDGVAISGAGARSTIVSAGGLSPVLSISGEAVATVSGLTLRDGAAGSGTGGNIQVGNTARLGLDHVRVTGGRASAGGGIGAVSSAALTISASLIDGNSATSGGGISLNDGGFGTPTRIQDTTIAFNTATQGGGIDLVSNASTTELRAVTIADNQGGGVYLGGSSLGASIAGSILARNAPFNCGGLALAADGGGNVESGSECGLAGHQNTNPQLATQLADGGGQTPVLPIAATSPAVDIVTSCLSPIDQRDVSRPQGGACDAGAFELVPAVAPPPPPVQPPPPAPTPTPQPQRFVTGRVVDGTIKVKVPGGQFVLLDPNTPIPVGSTIDSRNGEIRITALLKKGGQPQSARFFDGIFRITQTNTTTNLALTEALAKCPKRGGKASAAAKKKPKTRKLWGDGSGSFRTQGQYSAATVRGTEWLVQDSCSGTLTRVKHGVVAVRDNVRHRTIILRAGNSYLARPRKP